MIIIVISLALLEFTGTMPYVLAIITASIYLDKNYLKSDFKLDRIGLILFLKFMVMENNSIGLGVLFMFKNQSIKNFVLGFITYFVLAFILDLFGIHTIIVEIIIVAIIILVGYFIIPLYKKNNRS